MVSDISHKGERLKLGIHVLVCDLRNDRRHRTGGGAYPLSECSGWTGDIIAVASEISKMETGLIQINKKKLPLMDTVISALNRTYPKADEKEIEFVF